MCCTCTDIYDTSHCENFQQHMHHVKAIQYLHDGVNLTCTGHYSARIADLDNFHWNRHAEVAILR